ncbi:MAG: hypothetical protein J6A89_04155 [Clostridia bacterium]|nr:hypothetical protein [Clostridia bacterium]
MENNGNSYTTTGCLIFFILVIIIIFFVWKGISGNFSTNNSRNNGGKPDEIELMSYAQTVLKDNLSKPKYSSYKGDYTFIETGLRYKIEGNVTENGSTEKFYMIIQFVDDTYKEYDLISLQVGNKKIY